MSIRFPFLTIAIVLFSAFSALAQNDGLETATSSNLTAVSLPAGALRMSPADVPAEVDQTLDKLVSESGGKLRRSGTEVLVWTGNDLKRTGSRTIINRLTDTLKVAGWKYEIGATENGVTIFSALKDGAQRRAVIGFHGESDGALVFAWTELESNDAGQAANSPVTRGTTTGPTADMSGGSTADYDFPTPAGWSRSDSAGKIILTNGDDKMIAFLPPMDSSGDLQRDADRILWQAFKGHDTWYGNGFTPDYGQFERGKTLQGLEYFQAYRYAKPASESNESFSNSRFDAVILVVKLGSKVAVAVGRQPFQSPNYSDSAVTALDRILYDLKFKSIPNNYNHKNDVLGSWSAASTTVALAYTFNPNGSFSKGGAIEFRTRRDRDTDNVTTTSYGMTETYSITGNILTQNYKRTGQVYKHKVRVYQTKYDKDPWRQKMGWLSLADNPNNETIVLSKSE
jgi:hypothetical protein